jgi:hypothetical protein
MAMRTFRVIIGCVLVCFIAIGQVKTPLPVLRATGPNLTYFVEGKGYSPSWRIVPEYKPDILEVVCRKVPTEVRFLADTDSLEYSVRPGDKYYFYVLTPNGDSALTAIYGHPVVPPVTFSASYRSSHRGAVSIEVPEVKELLLVVISLTANDAGKKFQTNKTTEYYRAVQEYFSPYRSHPAVAQINNLLGLDQYSWMNLNAYCFTFCGDTIAPSPVYHVLSWSEVNNLLPYTSSLEDFARTSRFREFFAAHKALYENEIREWDELAPIRRMWSWLEERFPERFDSYKVIFSPLVGGTHFTNSVRDSGFAETIMCVCSPQFIHRRNSGESREFLSGIIGRVLFTEIDHNYVNPLMYQYRLAIDTIFSKRSIWANSDRSNDYRDAIPVFAEYMTWAVYTLYCSEAYPQEVFKKIKEDTEVAMTSMRGFTNFRAFNEELLRQYRRQSGNRQIGPLYPTILEWAAKAK